jgi:type IV secretory pathway VirB10-like protein
VSDAPDDRAVVIDRQPDPKNRFAGKTLSMVAMGIGVVVLIGWSMAFGGASEKRVMPAVLTPPRPNAERLEQLRRKDAAIPDPPLPVAALGAVRSASRVDDEPDVAPGRPAVDPETEAKRRKDYESLFASNVAWSKGGQKTKEPRRDSSSLREPDEPSPAQLPSTDEVAESVIRALNATQAPGTTPAAPPVVTPAPPAVVAPGAVLTPSGGALHRLYEGTVLDTVLANRLDGSAVAPVNVLTTNPIYAHDGVLVIPEGSRVLGSSRGVQGFGEERLAVSFHRAILPDGRSISLDKFVGLNPRGDAGLKDKVNRHYLEMFGASAAIGFINGLSQAFGRGVSGDDNTTVVIAGGVTDSTGQATAQAMNRFLNRLPTVTIREGHRLKVYLTSDLDLPSYQR